MNKHINLLFIILLMFFIGFLTSCKQDEDLALPRLFRPINFNVETNKTVATFTWSKVDSAVSYSLIVSTDSVNFSSPVIDTVLTQTSFTKELAGKTNFFAKLRANSNDTVKNSLFNIVSFSTPAENIFLGFGINNNTGTIHSAYMTDFNSLTIKWQPGSNTTHLILTSEDESVRDSVPLTASEILSGVKEVTSLQNSLWKVQIYNKTILRGTTYGTVEGDILLHSGEDLQAALNSALDGQTIILAAGAVYNTGSGTYRFDKSVKVRGLSVDNQPVVCMTIGTGTPPSSTSSMLGFVDGSTIQSVKFENVDFTGYVDNNSASTKVGYLFNNNTQTNVSKLSFTNCNMHNFGNTPMRVQGGKNQIIDSLSINGCTIYDIGFSSTYAIINSNSADFINTIDISNSTIYNFKGSLILRTGQPLKSVRVINCSINQGMQDSGSARYLMDFNNATFNGGGVTISNCILGQTGNAMGANGLRYPAGTSISISGSYYTTDYVDDPIPAGTTSTSIKANLNPYSGTSSSLWTDPVNGNFTFLDENFVGKSSAGDPRWR